jgi:PAS domain S-box-containing protein
VIDTNWKKFSISSISGVFKTGVSEDKLKNDREIEMIEKIQENERLYKSIVQAAMDGFWLINRQGKILEVNDAYCNMSGYTRQELICMSISDIVVFESKEEIARKMKEIYEKGQDRFVRMHRRKDGSLFEVEESLQCQPGPEGLQASFLRDITDRKKTEEAFIAKTEPFNYSLDLFYIADMDGYFRRLNPIWEKTLGYSPKELEGERFSDFIHSDDIETTMKAMEALKNQNEVLNFVNRYRAKDGNYHWIEWRAFPEGEIIYATGHDISKRKETEDALKQSEEKHRTILQTAIDGFILIDKYGNLVEVNDAYCKMSGYTRDELVGLNASVLEAAEPSEETEELISEIVEKETYRFMRKHKRKDGSLFDVEISSQYWAKDGGFVCFIRDITESKRLQESLAESLERLDLATNAAQLGIFDWDIKNNKFIWDDGMYSLYGIQRDNPESLLEIWSKMLHPDDREGFERIVDQVLHNDMTFDTEFRVISSDESIKHIKATGKVFKGPDGAPIRMVGVNFDITKNKEMESRLQQAQKMESIGTLAGGIAHDINNILYPIMMQAELTMEELQPDDPLQNSMGEIFAACKRARDLVKQIVTFSRQRTEKRIPLRFSQIVTESLNFIRSTVPTTINIQYENRSHKDTVLADPTQLKQIIVNLCTNAAHAMREKGGTLEIILDNEEISADTAGRVSNLKPGDYLKIITKDSGTGIPSNIIGRIYEPYYTTKKFGEGTGLGLAIIHGIVRNHDGDIIVESKVDHGSTFTVYLPLNHTEVPNFDEDKSEIQGGSEHILLVDDENAVVKIVHRMLEKYGIM